jgi:Holliday junction resolvase
MAANRNRTAGNNLERKYVNELKDIGFTGVVTSRAESRGLDNRKVDIFDLNDEFPFYVQVKNTLVNLNYHKLFTDSARDRHKPYIVLHQKTAKRGKVIRKVGEYAIMEKEVFMDLVRRAYRT